MSIKITTILYFVFSFFFTQSAMVYPTAAMTRHVTHSLVIDRTLRRESGDVFEITIFAEKTLSRMHMVVRNSAISFPLIGEAKVARLTTDGVTILLAEKLKIYLANAVGLYYHYESNSSPCFHIWGSVETRSSRVSKEIEDN